MNSHPTRIRLMILCAALLMAAPLFASTQKRRSVRHPSPGVAFQATVKGKVLDAATGLPINAANITFGNRAGVSNKDGIFLVSDATAYGEAKVTAGRSGYQTGTLTVTGGGTHDLTFRLQSTPTVTVKRTDGSSFVIDHESVQFGYVILFAGYVAAGEEDFCKPDGTSVKIAVAQMKRVIGPAVATTQSNCCNRPMQKVRLELRSGESTDAFFSDSCAGYTVDLIGRHHTTGDFVYTKFTDIAEVIFP